MRVRTLSASWFAGVINLFCMVLLVLQGGSYMKLMRRYADSTMNDAKALLPIEHEHLRVTVDDLVWHVPRPLEARHGGWEDAFMLEWKESHYDPTQRLECKNVNPNDTPYKSYLLCTVPAYVPARLPLDPSSQLITRVIFISWTSRKLGRNLFMSVMSLLHHNPEYELIFFEDDDIDRFVCQNYPELAPHFSMLRSSASRVDVWRMMAMKHYGGVSLGFDMSAIGHLPIHGQESVVAGMGQWSHLPGGHGGVLEHWILAFKPYHPLITTTLELIEQNLRDPTNPNVESQEARESEPSFDIRLTGPVPYQRALHQLLIQSQCQLVHGNFCAALADPRSYCNFTAFDAIFGNIVITGREMNDTVTPGVFDGSNERWVLDGARVYDSIIPFEGPSNFCAEVSLKAREEERIMMWTKKIEEKQDKLQ